MATTLASCLISTDEFARMRQRWNNLLRQSAADSVFLTHEWLFTWWQLFGRKNQLFIILVWTEEDELVGIAPFFIENRAVPLLGHIRMLSFIGCNQAAPDFLGLILKPGWQLRAIAEIARQLEAHRQEWDLMALESLLCQRADNDHFISTLIQSRRLLRLRCDLHCPYIDLPGSMEEYLLRFSPKHRKNIQRAARRISSLSGAAFYEPQNLQEAAALLQRLYALHALRSEAAERDSSFTDPDFQTFHNQLVKTAFAAGMVKLFALRIGAAAEAVLYGFFYRQRFYFYQTGFNPVYDHESIGSVILYHAIERAIALGCLRFEFLRGEEAYKYSWTREEEELQHIYLFRRRPGSMLLWGYRSGRHLAGQALRRVASERRN